MGAVPAGLPHHSRIEQDPLHVYAYDLVDGRYQPVADAAEELIVEKPFDIRPSLRDIAP
ncbi:Uma2 family endonuclease [Micromonospora musae]|uniref:Uma2 family endonuclease n=1 Tax=Micromonospora musae TaxID=1894970 RepID=A0A3A9XKE1_9ACTN|nr:Uma2 family endonuclease [Micromonospora musae]RKN25675.1 Uma2 family endonuclease [Micromonospora musae]